MAARLLLDEGLSTLPPAQRIITGRTILYLAAYYNGGQKRAQDFWNGKVVNKESYGYMRKVVMALDALEPGWIFPMVAFHHPQPVRVAHHRRAHGHELRLARSRVHKHHGRRLRIAARN
jgi:hypothetical protein